MPEEILGNRYRIIEKIGEGGMATVYQAEDTLLERIVAIKVLREQYANDPAFLARFKQEARAAAGVTHQNIVSVYDVGAEQSKNYIVMEYVEGSSLKQLILQGAPFNNARAISLSLQILAALGFAHQKGLIHRDIKPQNILVTPEGHVKVTDFGIARAITSAQLTETGQVLGTVHYCCPEQAQGRAVSEPSDIYSVGVVMYEMLTGRLPFDGEGALAIALKHLQEEPVEPSSINPRVPPQLEAIVLKAMAKDPVHRYGSAEEMRQALLHYQQLSDQSTSQFTAVKARTTHKPATASGRATGGSTAGHDAWRQATSRARTDWVAVVLVLMILVALVGWIPLGQRVYQTFFASGGGPGVPTQVTSTPTVAADADIQVPDLKGMQYAAAEDLLSDLGLRIDAVGEEYSDEYDMLEIVSQNVEPDSKLKARDVVGVVVSKGREWVTIPNLVGEEMEAAREEMEGMGLHVRVVQENNAEVDEGLVFRHDPEFDKKVRGGSFLTLYVSKGAAPVPTARPTRTPTPVPVVTPSSPSRVIVPNVVGLPEEQAKRIIEDAQLRTTYTNWQTADDVADEDFFYSVPVGHVLSQQPRAGLEVDKFEVVNIAARKE